MLRTGVPGIPDYRRSLLDHRVRLRPCQNGSHSTSARIGFRSPWLSWVKTIPDTDIFLSSNGHFYILFYFIFRLPDQGSFRSQELIIKRGVQGDEQVIRDPGYTVDPCDRTYTSESVGLTPAEGAS